VLSTRSKRFLKHNTPTLVRKYRDWRTNKVFGDTYWDARLSKTLNLVEGLENKPFSTNMPSAYSKKLKRPTHAVVEINNTCNINCVMCQTQSATRKKGRMTTDLLEETLDKLQFAGITNVALHTLGDPLANPRLGEVFAELRKRGLTTSICTNGLLLPRHADTLLDYMDICPSISFSVDGATAETYERIRLGGKWKDLITALELNNKKLRPRGMTTKIQMTVSKDNVHEVGMLIENFSKYVAYPAQDLAFHVITGLAPDNTYFNTFNLFTNHTHKNSMCTRVQGDPLWFNVDGTVSACCRDYHGELYVGDIRKHTFDEILEGEGLRKMQEAHESGDLSAYPPCNDCFRPDKRLDEIFNSTVQFFIRTSPKATAAYYQKRVDDLCGILQSNGNYREKVEALLSKTI
tara:strand:+ start:895 stop:2109 length:1215 start_codon:yes stop_codon:yes gene_type:complete